MLQPSRIGRGLVPKSKDVCYQSCRRRGRWCSRSKASEGVRIGAIIVGLDFSTLKEPKGYMRANKIGPFMFLKSLRVMTMNGMDKLKNHKKAVKNEQARTRKSEEYKKKPKNQSRSQKSQASVKSAKVSQRWSTKVNKPHNIPF
ncbi:hypothetical protein Tco_0488134 [Tanacetum coccineum]